MNRQIILNKVEAICHRIFGEQIKISEQTSAADIERWDSMNHVVLISAIEEEFSISFDIMEIIELHTIGNFIDLIEKKRM